MKPQALLFTCALLISSLPRAQAVETSFDEMPVPVKSVAPDYPADMKRAGASGMVFIQIVVNESGDVVERVVTKSTRREFESAALEAIQNWKFKPAKKGGVTVSAKITVPLKFNAES